MEICYLDQWLIVINKPAGLLSIADGYNLALPHVRTVLEPEFGRCWIVHRLDKDTSGTLLLARSQEIHRALSILFETRMVKKQYRTLVFGVPSESTFSVEAPLRVNADRHHRTRIDIKKGKPASTRFELLETFENHSLLSAMPLTGYTHQIRAHLAFVNHPILGDELYFGLSNIEQIQPVPEVPRLSLHAYSLEFIHPATNMPIRAISSIPGFFGSSNK